MQLVAEKEFVISMLTTSHDLHVLRIDQREDALVRNSNEWITSVIDDFHEHTEMRRNRERIIEIHHFIEHQRDLADEIEDEVIIQPVFSEEFLDADASNVQRVETAVIEPVDLASPEVQED